MQIYRDFNIGTATPSREELDIFPHTGINELSPEENYSVAEFLERADEEGREAESRGLVPFVLGGTGMYINAFLYGLDEMPPANKSYRNRLKKLAEKRGKEYLHERLQEIDPRAGEKIHPNDRRRVIRALEIYYQTGKTKTRLTAGEKTLREEIDPLVVGLHRPREELEGRISRRVEKMLEQGLIQEVKRLRGEYTLAKTVRQAIGFKEVVQYLDGTVDRREMVDKIIDNTLEFARKQKNWFKKFPVEKWYHPVEDKKELIDKIERKLSD